MRIFLLVGSEILKEGFNNIFNKQKDFEITGDSQNTEALFKSLNKNEVDVVLIEILNSETSSLNIIKTIAEKYPAVKILVFSMHLDERFGVKALKAGASGFLTKHAGSKEIVAAVITIMKGNRYIEASLSESISLKTKSKYYFLSHEKLSGREYEVLRMMASGKRMSEIAAELSLSINTVSTYRARIFEKMNMRSTAELIRYVIEHNLFS